MLAVALVLGGAQAKHSSHGQASNSGSGSGSGSWLDDRLVRLPPDKDPGARASEAAAAAETQAQAGGGGSGRLGAEEWRGNRQTTVTLARIYP